MRGSCVCGNIQYELNNKFLIANHCQCSICRKMPEATLAPVDMLRQTHVVGYRENHCSPDIDRPQYRAMVDLVNWYREN